MKKLIITLLAAFVLLVVSMSVPVTEERSITVNREEFLSQPIQPSFEGWYWIQHGPQARQTIYYRLNVWGKPIQVR